MAHHTSAIGHPIPVLLVDRDHEDLGGLVGALHDAGPPGSPRYTVWCFSEPADVLGGLPEVGPAVILFGNDPTDESDLEWLERFVGLEIGPVIQMAADGDAEQAARALEIGASDYLVKSRVLRHPAMLHRIIRQALTGYGGEQPARAYGRYYLWLLGEVRQQSRRTGEIVERLQKLIEGMQTEVRLPLELARKYPGMLADRMDESATPGQAGFTDALAATVAELAGQVALVADEGLINAESGVAGAPAPAAVEAEEPDPAQQSAELRVLLSNSVGACDQTAQAAAAVEPKADAGQATGREAAKATRKATKKSTSRVETARPKRDAKAMPKKKTRSRRAAGKTAAAPRLHVPDAAPATIDVPAPTLRLATGAGDDHDEIQLADVPGLVWGASLQSYVERLQGLADQPSKLALIRFTLRDPEGSIEAMEDFLRPTGKPLDLWLDADDGRSMLAIRPTDLPAVEAGEWIRRIQSAWWSAVLRGSTDGRNAFDATCLGAASWPLAPQVIASLGAPPDLRKAA